MDGWDFADGWVFAAVAGYRRPVTLAEVIAAGDALNHAILTPDEIEAAVSALTAAGLLVVEDDHFQPTEAGRTLWDSAPDRLGQFATVRWVADRLARRTDPPQRGRWALPPGAYDDAVAGYLRQARRHR